MLTLGVYINKYTSDFRQSTNTEWYHDRIRQIVTSHVKLGCQARLHAQCVCILIMNAAGFLSSTDVSCSQTCSPAERESQPHNYIINAKCPMNALASSPHRAHSALRVRTLIHTNEKQYGQQTFILKTGWLFSLHFLKAEVFREALGDLHPQKLSGLYK